MLEERRIRATIRIGAPPFVAIFLSAAAVNFQEDPPLTVAIIGTIYAAAGILSVARWMNLREDKGPPDDP